MITAIHQSILNMFLKCGEQGRRRYIENEIIPPGIAALRGTGTHKGAEINHKQKIETHTDLPLSDIKDATRDAYVHKAKKDGIYLPKELVSQKNTILNIGLIDALRCTECYHKDIAPNIQPVAAEERIEPIEIGLELPLSIKIDYWQQNHKLGDLKTAGMKWQKDRITQEIQPVLYSLGYLITYKKNPTFRYDITIARHGKDGNATSIEADHQEMTATNQDYSALYAKMEALIEMLKTGIFPPSNQNNWWCDPKWCGFWYTCKFVGNAPAKKWI